VTGSRWIVGAAGAVVVVGVVVVGVAPAAAPPVEAARALGAPTAKKMELQTIALRVDTRKTTTSFVGLRG
jgi:hypothetical protein